MSDPATERPTNKINSPQGYVAAPKYDNSLLLELVRSATDIMGRTLDTDEERAVVTAAAKFLTRQFEEATYPPVPFDSVPVEPTINLSDGTKPPSERREILGLEEPAQEGPIRHVCTDMTEHRWMASPDYKTARCTECGYGIRLVNGSLPGIVPARRPNDCIHEWMDPPEGKPRKCLYCGLGADAIKTGWEFSNERTVKWDKEQTAYLRERLGSGSKPDVVSPAPVCGFCEVDDHYHCTAWSASKIPCGCKHCWPEGTKRD